MRIKLDGYRRHWKEGGISSPPNRTSRVRLVVSVLIEIGAYRLRDRERKEMQSRAEMKLKLFLLQDRAISPNFIRVTSASDIRRTFAAAEGNGNRSATFLPLRRDKSRRGIVPRR